jgi:hypothetical protein
MCFLLIQLHEIHDLVADREDALDQLMQQHAVL